MAIPVSIATLATLNNQSILTQSNSNFTNIQTALQNALSTTNQSPNSMQSNLDMNGNEILNLPSPQFPTSPVRLQDVTSTTIPVGFPTLSGDVAGSYNSGTQTVVTTVNNVHGVSYPASPSTNTVPVVTGTNAITYEAVPGSAIASATITGTNIASNTVANSNLANVGANTVKGSIAGGSPSDLTQTQLTSLINPFTSSLSGATPSSGGGTSNFLRADATWASPTASGSLVAVNYYTTSQIITIPAAIKAVVRLVGGGGGGGGGTAAAVNEFVFPGNGGGGGGLVKFLTGLTAGNTLVLTIGTAGSGGAAGANNGTAGGSTTLASGTQTITTLTAGGGGLGAAATGNASNTAYGAMGAGGTSTNGDVNVTGSPGFNGGVSAFGFGGPGNFTNTVTSENGVAAVGFGGGGGGGNISGVVANVSGAAGTAGICEITWYS